MKRAAPVTLVYASIFTLLLMAEVFAQDQYVTITKIENPARSRANLRDSFDKKAQLTAVDIPLKELLISIGKQHDLSVKADLFAAPSLSQTVTITTRATRLSEVLRKICQSLDLTYVVRDDTLVITTSRNAAANPRAKVITVPHSLLDDKIALAKALSWSLALGNFHARATTTDAVTVVGDSLRVVGHARKFHEVELFLEEMNAMKLETR